MIKPKAPTPAAPPLLASAKNGVPHQRGLPAQLCQATADAAMSNEGLKFLLSGYLLGKDESANFRLVVDQAHLEPVEPQV